ncbi:hypothetical protein FYJ51_01670 [Erysipelotrichaceae bacterium Oil+RF-744-GAM-WT-6]|uniref:Uncharacterized protein n=1 Tax=Stecheria intestinalis TaxID=2606630 RepID=A0A7X2TFC5_9FIRM|nr:hypothetical protein [Stecheria intestinalis]MSS57618.1 hypothetical protein [Stecheria intestinalis]
MTEKWTKARCERELKNPANWEIDFAERYIVESSFEFYSLRFVKSVIKRSNSDWCRNSRGAYLPVAMHGYEYDERDLFVVMHGEDDTTALTRIGKADAVEMMMDALKKEGLSV